MSNSNWRRVDEQRGRVLADIRLLELDGPSDLNYRKYLYIIGKEQPRHSEDVGAWTRDYRERLHARLVDIELEAERQREQLRGEASGEHTLTGRIRLKLRSRITQAVLALITAGGVGTGGYVSWSGRDVSDATEQRLHAIEDYVVEHRTEARLRIEQFQRQFDALDKRLDRIEATHESMRRGGGNLLPPINSDSRAEAFRRGADG